MKTVVITGSARGLGLEMAKVFRKNNLNVVISDLNEEKLKLAKEELYNKFEITTIKNATSDLATKMIDYLNKKVGAKSWK